MVLPGRLDGIDLARVASLRWPWIRVVVTSGWARVKDLPQNVVFLPKPWRATDLHAQLEWEEMRPRASLGSGIHSSACLRGTPKEEAMDPLTAVVVWSASLVGIAALVRADSQAERGRPDTGAHAEE